MSKCGFHIVKKKVSVLFRYIVKRLCISIILLFITRFFLDFGFTWAWAIPFLDSLDWLLSFMDGLPHSVGGDGSGASSSRRPPFDLPAAEEDPEDRHDIQRALDRVELAKIQQQKDRLASLPLISAEKERLRRRFWHRELGELPSPNEMVEMIINRFASDDARNANKPNVPRAKLRYLKTWLTRAEKSAEQDGQGNMSIQNHISTIIQEFFKSLKP